MKVLGIGVDIIENKRIKSSIKNSNFINRIYTSKELRLSILSKNKANYFSKRFAANRLEKYLILSLDNADCLSSFGL